MEKEGKGEKGRSAWKRGRRKMKKGKTGGRSQCEIAGVDVDRPNALPSIFLVSYCSFSDIVSISFFQLVLLTWLCECQLFNIEISLHPNLVSCGKYHMYMIALFSCTMVDMDSPSCTHTPN